MAIMLSCRMARYVMASSSASCCRLLSSGVEPERCNHIGIQMLSRHLQEQLFGQESSGKLSESAKKKIEKHLQEQNLWEKPMDYLSDVDFKLPEMRGTKPKTHDLHQLSVQTLPATALHVEL